MKTNPDKKQVEYWKERNELMFLQGESKILDYIDELKKHYELAARNIDDIIYKFYGKFAVENNYTMQDLNKLLNKEELKDFKKSIDDIRKYATNHKLDDDYKNQLKLLRLKSRISRLQELKTNIQFEIEKLYKETEDSLQKELKKAYEMGYYQTLTNMQQFIGISANFAMLNAKAIEKAVSTPYMVENYSQVLWKNKQQLLNILNQQIPQGIILGYNPRKLAKEIVSKRVDRIAYNNTARLIRTEYNLILNDATARGYAEAGIDRYQILATLDSRTSDICRQMDGEIILLKEKEVGINYPPFHPNCRTTTIPYFEPDEFDVPIEMYIKDEFGNRTKIKNEEDYLKWKNALRKEE